MNTRKRNIISCPYWKATPNRLCAPSDSSQESLQPCKCSHRSVEYHFCKKWKKFCPQVKIQCVLCVFLCSIDLYHLPSSILIRFRVCYLDFYISSLQVINCCTKNRAGNFSLLNIFGLKKNFPFLLLKIVYASFSICNFLKFSIILCCGSRYMRLYIQLFVGRDEHLWRNVSKKTFYARFIHVLTKRRENKKKGKTANLGCARHGNSHLYIHTRKCHPARPNWRIAPLCGFIPIFHTFSDRTYPE